VRRSEEKRGGYFVGDGVGGGVPPSAFIHLSILQSKIY